MTFVEKKRSENESEEKRSEKRTKEEVVHIRIYAYTHIRIDELLDELLNELGTLSATDPYSILLCVGNPLLGKGLARRAGSESESAPLFSLS